MIKEIEFANYRIFAERQKLLLAPITIVFGKNNVGKSALLKLPLLIKSILKTPESDSELFGNSVFGVHICEDYSDVVYGKGNRAVSISIKDGSNYAVIDFFVERNGKQRTKIETLTGRTGDKTSINNITQLSNLFKFDIEYLKSIRDCPNEGYFSLYEKKLDPNPAGGMFAYRRLGVDEIENSGELFNKISKWYETTFDGWSIELDTSRAPIFSFLLRHDKIKTNIVDCGAGIAQSFPVVVSAASPVVEPTLCIYEEPETHLHPEAHGDIAEFIAMQAIHSSGNKTFLIETHSVNFLLRLRTLVAKGILQKDDIAIYYVNFDRERTQSSINRVTLYEDGSVEGWPENVFKETLEEALALRRAQLRSEEE